MVRKGKCSFEMKEVIEGMLKKRAQRISLTDIKKYCQKALDNIQTNHRMVLPIRKSESDDSRRSFHDSSSRGIQKQHKMNGQRNPSLLNKVVGTCLCVGGVIVGMVGLGAVLAKTNRNLK